jgi:hypothetical protein
LCGPDAKGTRPANRNKQFGPASVSQNAGSFTRIKSTKQIVNTGRDNFFEFCLDNIWSNGCLYLAQQSAFSPISSYRTLFYRHLDVDFAYNL